MRSLEQDIVKVLDHANFSTERTWWSHLDIFKRFMFHGRSVPVHFTLPCLNWILPMYKVEFVQVKNNLTKVNYNATNLTIITQ